MFVRITLNGMQLAEADLREFIEIWQDEFQESISIEDARHSASMLMELYALLLESVSISLLRASESSLPDYRT